MKKRTCPDCGHAWQEHKIVQFGRELEWECPDEG